MTNTIMSNKELKRLYEFVNGISIRPDITKREWIARYYEQFARHIREMKWVTAERFYADPDKVCPKCGSDKLDLD